MAPRLWLLALALAGAGLVAWHGAVPDADQESAPNEAVAGRALRESEFVVLSDADTQAGGANSTGKDASAADSAGQDTSRNATRALERKRARLRKELNDVASDVQDAKHAFEMEKKRAAKMAAAEAAKLARADQEVVNASIKEQELQAELLETHDYFAMSAASWAAFVAFSCCCTCCMGGFCIGHVSEFGISFAEWSFPGRSCMEACLDCLGFGSDLGLGSISRLVTREARFMVLLPLIPLPFLPGFTCEDGAPTAAYIAYLPFLIRAKVIEVRLLYALSKGTMTILMLAGVLMGILEHIDWFTDGIFPLQAYSCDAALTPRWAATFYASPFSPFAGVVMRLRFWGIAALAFMLCVVAQQTSSAPKYNYLYGPHCSANVAGYSAVGEWLESELDKGHRADASSVALSTAITKVVLENIIQLWLQTSFFALTYDSTSTLAKYKQLLSIGAGLTVASSKLCWLAYCILKAEHWGPDGTVVLVSVLGLLVLLAIMAVKFYMTSVCASHFWNVTSGCVDMGSLI